ncbi:MAG TPA: hypothetical protein VGS11_02600 [Candidatus Bathyarchaeia archaeon]|nr:hypothetical protein [Candidatus Bathyarchaeia archaeon]
MTLNNFDELVATSAEEAVSKMLGHEVWKAVAFYFDMGKLASQPESFCSVLSKLFGASSRVLQTIIVDRINAKVGITTETRKDRDFKDWIQIARYKFQSLSGLTIQK